MILHDGCSLPIKGPPKKDPEKPRVPPYVGLLLFLRPEYPMSDLKALAREIAKRKPARFVE